MSSSSSQVSRKALPQRLEEDLANASAVAGSDATAFRAKRVTFKTIMEQQSNSPEINKGGVKVAGITDDPKPISRMSDPGNPAADKDG
jgi:flagellar basal-body rod protein FlgC